MRIVTQEEMKQIESRSFEEFHLSESLIVENVGATLARSIERELQDRINNLQFILLIGKGNNGADGVSLARNLVNRGHQVRAFTPWKEETWSEELKSQVQRARAFGVKINELESVDILESFIDRSALKYVIVDALFGTGIRLPLSDFIYDLLGFVNKRDFIRFAIDIPSGVEGDTGHVHGRAFDADVTFAVGLPKLGCYLSAGSQYCGDLKVIGAGFPKPLLEGGDMRQVQIEDYAPNLEKRDRFADKKVFGHSLVIGGSHGLTGALVLASQAALKAGAGLVTGATWEAQYQEYLARLIPEVMSGYIPNDEKKWAKVIEGFKKYNSIVMGPGMGVSARTRRAVLNVLNGYEGPVVLDADAINIIKKEEDEITFRSRTAPVILTPHLGEFSRLIGVDRDKVRENPLDYLKQAVDTFNATIILKGPCTYIGCPSNQIYFNLFPNDGMATGGSGDVLAGILGGLIAQDTVDRYGTRFQQTKHSSELEYTIVLSVLAHTRAGFHAYQSIGPRAMTAMSLINFLPNAFDELKQLSGKQSSLNHSAL